jgi:hypothetical protein
MQIRTDQIASGGTPCGCGRSPTGKCCGWHALTEEGYMEKLNTYLQEVALEEKEKHERTVD